MQLYCKHLFGVILMVILELVLLAFGTPAQVEIKNSVFPSYGFDEWFLQAALFPRIATKGGLDISLLG